LVLLGLACLGASPHDPDREVREAVWAGHWLKGVRQYREIERAGQAASPQASYLAGLALWKLRRPEEAQPLLEKALKAGFRAGGDRPQPEELLQHIARYREAKPPPVEVAGLDRTRLDPYADDSSERSRAVLAALPRILELGRAAFGDPPPLRFFLFAKKPALARFWGAFQETAAREAEVPHSTGVVNMVIYCAEKAQRSTPAETISLALHEATHAWVATYLRNHTDRVIPLPKYLSEGLAVYVASMWSDEVHALASQRVATWRKTHAAPPPEFKDLGPDQTFSDPDKVNPNYWLSDLLVERLLGPPSVGAKRIPALLDALARSGDDAAAWREITGRDVAKEYQALLSETFR